MSDIVDRAEEREEEIISDGIAHARAALPYGESSEQCRVCDEPIPENRRIALPGVKTCIFCQEELERGLQHG